MAELKTEEEQIEAFKVWWKKNGMALVVAVVVGVGGYFGFNSWQQSQVDHVNEASILFESLNDAMTDLSNPEQAKTASFIAEQLTTDFSDTGYAMFAYLYQARIAAEAKDFDTALEKLSVVENKTDDVTLKAMANLQSVKILLAKSNYDQALAKLELVNTAEFSGQKNELKGDILLAKGDRAGARDAYQAASDALKQTAVPTPLLDIKLKDLAEK
ncbi:tetratricopeptide repeat protein [Marinomonas agarivorans]|nr:tetratricopeptide repeat protein [Marinomonas agarivorans]